MRHDGSAAPIDTDGPKPATSGALAAAIRVNDSEGRRARGAQRRVNETSTVGLIANPASARDLRRIVAHGGAVTTHDKLNRLQRVLAGLAATGVRRVIAMPDRAGITAGLLRLAGAASARAWPALEFVDQPVTHTEADTIGATRAMVETGVGAIVVLGGDGTNRVVARESADVPLVSISTGTNNAFPRPVEPTVAGLAGGLVARHRCCREAGTYRAKKLVVRCGPDIEDALVDVAITAADGVGSGAIWDANTIHELFLTFAEPDAIGLSAIGAQLQPTTRREAAGLQLRLDPNASTVVWAPVGPGLVPPVGVASISTLAIDSPVPVAATTGVIAVDGERRLRFGPIATPTVTLSAAGPAVVDAAETMAHAAANGLLRTTSSRSTANQTPKGEPT
ncbi:MAG: NAD(+)/NADH kinase [Actinomycetota bacterium]